MERPLDKIYTVWVGCLNKDGTRYKLGTRTWAWFKTFEEAEHIIINNIIDICEYSYNYACVEEVCSGMFGDTKVIQWYRSTFDKDKMKDGPYPEVIKCEEPPMYKMILGISMG